MAEAAQITKNMLIGDLVKQFPSVTEVLLDHGVHCVGCGAANFETIEQGLGGHGYAPEEIDEIVQELNDAIPKELGEESDLVITENAATKLQQILKEQGKEGMGLRIKVEAGGCSGYQYGFDLEEQEHPGDQVIEVLGVKFYVDAESKQLLKGAKVDYLDALQGAGFKITNPNVQKSCRCGQSFS